MPVSLDKQPQTVPLLVVSRRPSAVVLLPTVREQPAVVLSLSASVLSANTKQDILLVWAVRADSSVAG